jgi:hypothetical protein
VLQFKDYQPIPKFRRVLGPPPHKSKKTTKKSPSSLEIERIKFWKSFIKKVEESMLDQNDLKASTDYCIGSNSDIEGITYNYIIKQDWSAIELFLNHEDPQVNRERFKKLEQKKAEIEKKFHEVSWHLTDDLDWNFEKTRAYQSIRYKLKKGGLADKKLWDQIQYSMIDTVKSMKESFEKHIFTLFKKEK